MDEKRHRCGGLLRLAEVEVSHRLGNLLFIQTKVDGLVCDSCGEKLLERDTAVALEAMVLGLPQTVLLTKDHAEVSSQLDRGTTISSPGSVASGRVLITPTVSSEFAGRG
jgi:hypothetical protein